MAAYVVIVVLNWNGREDTLACLGSLQHLTPGDTRVVVVDNGSTDGSVDAIRQAFPAAELIENDKNLGYAEGNNVGIRYALDQGADFVLVLNNDTTCAPDLIDRLVAAAARHPRAGLFCPRMFYMAEPERVWFDAAEWNSAKLSFDFPGQDQLAAAHGDADHETAFACGAALFVRAAVVREVGSFDPSFFLVWEEVDWCYRARKAGWASMVVPTAHIWHRVGASFGTEASPLRTYFSFRNRLVWLARHGSMGERLRALSQAVGAIVPPWSFAPDPPASATQLLAWAARDWLVALRGHGKALQYLATRRAVLDYFAGRLGPPPDLIHDLNRRWLQLRTR